jgi:alginate O-acetyltransferase complex protein AlgI
MKNFNAPYLAHNIAAFWKRWHISLSTWFRDYLYIPLGGSRVSFALMCTNLFVVFMVSGLWHGASWKYLVWGLIHGCLLICYHLSKKANININGWKFLKWLITFHLVCLAWIFFRAYNINEAFYIIGRIFTGGSFSYQAMQIMPLTEIAYGFLIVVLLLLAERYLPAAKDYSTGKKLALTLSLIIACYFLGIFNEAQFIYFQF